MSRKFASLIAAALAITLIAPASRADDTKTLTGKVRSVKDNRVIVQKSGLLRESEVEIEMTDATKKTGQVAAGMHVKVKYREEKAPDGAQRLVAVEIEARPEFASKEAKKLAKEQKSKPN
jgi:hypothetical protein